MKKDTKGPNRLPPSAKNISSQSPAKILPLDGSVSRRYIRCGRKNCRCQNGELHGPYVYVQVYRGGERRWQYVRNSEIASLFSKRQQSKLEIQQTKSELAEFRQQWQELKSLLRSMG
jgi:hypothetical protein